MSSSASVDDVIEILVQKFRPDLRMLPNLASYSLYEVHDNGGKGKAMGCVGGGEREGGRRKGGGEREREREREREMSESEGKGKDIFAYHHHS